MDFFSKIEIINIDENQFSQIINHENKKRSRNFQMLKCDLKEYPFDHSFVVLFYEENEISKQFLDIFESSSDLIFGMNFFICKLKNNNELISEIPNVYFFKNGVSNKKYTGIFDVENLANWILNLN